jgi:hypothetical protein
VMGRKQEGSAQENEHGRSGDSEYRNSSTSSRLTNTVRLGRALRQLARTLTRGKSTGFIAIDRESTVNENGQVKRGIRSLLLCGWAERA